jgi:hypothetical protein
MGRERRREAGAGAGHSATQAAYPSTEVNDASHYPLSSSLHTHPLSSSVHKHPPIYDMLSSPDVEELASQLEMCGLLQYLHQYGDHDAAALKVSP